MFFDYIYYIDIPLITYLITLHRFPCQLHRLLRVHVQEFKRCWTQVKFALFSAAFQLVSLIPVLRVQCVGSYPRASSPLSLVSPVLSWVQTPSFQFSPKKSFKSGKTFSHTGNHEVKRGTTRSTTQLAASCVPCLVLGLGPLFIILYVVSMVAPQNDLTKRYTRACSVGLSELGLQCRHAFHKVFCISFAR